MKRVKKYISICALVLSPTAILAAKPSFDQLNQSSALQSKVLKQLILTTVPQPQVAAPKAGAVKLNDIQPNNTLKISKEFIKAQHLQSVLNKAQKTGQLGYVVGKLEQKQLPRSLALIPVIESQYKSGAVSNKGAGGIWQLMPGTAKELGIAAKDRYQMQPSTDAALKYFQKLHKKFGNWELAIAAYNAGDGAVQRALAKNPSAKNVQDLKLPRETKEYVQKFYQLESYAAEAIPTAVEA